MRAVRVVVLLAVAALVALLGGSAAGAVPTPAALWRVVTGAPAPPAAAPVAAPAPTPTPTPTPVPTTPTPTPAPTPAPTPTPEPEPPRTVPGTPCLSTAAACVDLSANEAWLLDGGAVALGPVPITHGRRGYRTPPGTFRVSYKDADHVSSIFDGAPMPYSVFFNGGIAFHQGSLRQQSHGCVHLSRDAAKAFYGGLSRGDVVQVVQ